MTTSEQISEICDAIAREFNPEKIIVFGSHAYGSRSRSERGQDEIENYALGARYEGL